MKIATSLDHGKILAGLSWEETARIMKDSGYNGIDLNMCDRQMDADYVLSDEWHDDIVRQAEAAKIAGLEILQCHFPVVPGEFEHNGKKDYEAFENFRLSGVIRAIETAAEIGCPVGVFHPYFMMSADPSYNIVSNISFCRRLIPYLEKYNVRLALENVYNYISPKYINVFPDLANNILQICEESGSDLVGACIDTGHANICGLNITDMAVTYGKRLFALHVNGNCGRHDEHVLPMNMAAWCEHTDYKKFVKALVDIGFTGPLNLEVCTQPMSRKIVRPYYAYSAAIARYIADFAD